MLADVDMAVSMAFLVKLDDESLGTFATCEGLGCEVVLESREEGGNNDFVWQLPTRLKYPNVKLTRPLGRDTEKLTKLIARMATGYSRCTGTIEAMSSNGETVATWALHGVVPVRWTGPSFNADTPKILTETLEIAHHGFLVTGGR